MTLSPEQEIMAGHGKLNTIPADPGLRCSEVRGFLLQVPWEDLFLSPPYEPSGLYDGEALVPTNVAVRPA